MSRIKIFLFIVFLANVSCSKKMAPITIPFKLTKHNNIKIKTILNGSDSLNLKFDSGTTGLLLTHKAIKEKTSLLNNSKEKVPTKNYVKLKSKASLKIGLLEWNNLDIYPVMHSGQGTDGRFGWDLFKNQIIEINYDKNLIIVHDKLPDIKGYSKSKISFCETLLCIDGSIIINKKSYNAPFMLDSGYQRALLLDSILMKEQVFPKNLKLLKINQLRNGAGKIFVTKVIELPEITFAKQKLKKIPTQLLNTTNPAHMKSHIMGNELLKRFNTIFDFKNKKIYLKPNSLINKPYIDAS